MKLRNKKTGEGFEIVFCPTKEEWEEKTKHIIDFVLKEDEE